MVDARTIALAACAVSAGVHAGLAPSHLAGSAALGGLFLAAAAGLAAAALALALRPESRLPALGAAGLLLALLAAYPLAGDGLGGLGLATKAVEAAGLVAAIGTAPSPRRPGPVAATLCALVAVAVFAIAGMAGAGHGHG